MARNHVDAIAFGELDLRVVLQGGGVDLLMAAKRDANLATQIDALRANGVRFIVCRNTLVLRGLDPATQFHGVKHDDIVSASVAETARLVAQGFAYLKF